MKNIAISITTLSSSAQAVIVSISALEFDLHSDRIGETFTRLIDIDSCLQLGLTVDGLAFRHWAANFNAADGRIPVTLINALHDLTSAFEWSNKTIWVDLTEHTAATLDTAYRKIGSRVPWAFYNVRDAVTQLDGQPVTAIECAQTVQSIARALQFQAHQQEMRHGLQA